MLMNLGARVVVEAVDGLAARRITSIIFKPRAMVKLGDFYVPEPCRPLADSEPALEIAG